MWWADLGWLPGAHPAALSLALISRTRRENKIKKVVGKGKDREITYQLSSQAKQIQLGEN